ncbi:MAG: PilC/PilY family type IV pilus protein [Methylococcales bacterium]|nr:PilC/PilY family type IV pilus protein [Methylococcales bacterium]
MNNWKFVFVIAYQAIASNLKANASQDLNTLTRQDKTSLWPVLFGFFIGSLATMPVQAQLSVAQAPLFLTQAAEPVVMLNISNDHQLYFKAYDDFSDLDGDGIPETSYKHSIDYFGYFDSYKCYQYQSGVFVPQSTSSSKYCSGQWSGNFLNWASMTRIDAIRKILYGGMRSTDTSRNTILERSYLPNDAHSIAKFYNGSDLNQLTPFTASTGITLCSTTVTHDSHSQFANEPPLLRVAKGDFSLWAAAERWQCRWKEEKGANNSNNPSISGLNAASSNPSNTLGLGEKNYIVRVQACITGMIGTENCKTYGSSLKPIGLLQTYGDEDKIRFGLITGSYNKNISGGVLRKNVGPMADEIDLSNGTFKTAPAAGSIIGTLNTLRIYGWRNDNGTYFGNSDSDNCDFRVSNLVNGSCTNWGNPQSEIYLESLRYLAGLNASPNFDANDSSRITGLVTANWQDPIPATEWCANLNVIQFNASTSSFDNNELASASDIGLTNLGSFTDDIGSAENITGNSFFIGANGIDNNRLCTAKTVNNLSTATGTCPDAPRQEGSYQIAGLAYYAKTNSIRNDLPGEQKVTTYGVSLAPALPKVAVPVPGVAGKKITILPACQNRRENTNCSIVDFKIVSQTTSSNKESGKLFVNWETGEQGGDFDMDMLGVIDYEVTSSKVTVTTNAFTNETGAAMGFGYIINGTTQDGFHAHSGINSYDYTDPTGVNGCSNCSEQDSATSVTYDIGSSSAQSLEQPLWYAAKWGGFIDGNNNDLPDLNSEWDQNGDGLPDRYFLATNPAQLAQSLAQALSDVIASNSSASSVATNATRLDTTTVLYQAKFNSADWTGQLLAFALDTQGEVSDTPLWDSGVKVTQQGFLGRSIYSANPAQSPIGIFFDHDNLNAAQKSVISKSTVNYIRGDRSQEEASGGTLRTRIGPNALLGDMVNSDPWLVGTQNFGYDRLPGTEGSSYVNYRGSNTYRQRSPLVAIGGNDGMLHFFDATVTEATSSQEVFAYVPHTLLPALKALTLPNYTAPGQHRFFVDGSPIASDAYIDVDGDGDKEWRTMTVGTLGAGGKAIFALDTTFIDPNNLAQPETTFKAERVLWEINTDSGADFANDLGLTIGQASIVRLHDGEFAVVFGNGYNSADGKAVLYIVNAKTGALIKKIDTSVSGNNGLATPIAVDVDGDRITDAIYAGDLKGNLWKFDVSNSNASKWDVAFKKGSNTDPLFVATDRNGNLQPITAKPQVGRHPSSGVMVYFGTGKFFEAGDNDTSNAQVQTFYGVWDNDEKIANSRGDLVEQTIEAETTVGNFNARVTSNNELDYAGSDKGWYMDLVTPPQPGTATGEKVISQALLRNGRVIFVTIIPDNTLCSFGGTSWLMEFEAVTGKRLETTPFDLSGDHLVDSADMITETIDTNDDGVIDDSDDAVAASGKQSTVGMIKAPGVISAGSLEHKYASGSTGAIERTVETADAGTGRQSWRQLR